MTSKQSSSAQVGMLDGPSGLFEFNCFAISLVPKSVTELNLNLVLCIIGHSVLSWMFLFD